MSHAKSPLEKSLVHDVLSAGMLEKSYVPGELSVDTDPAEREDHYSYILWPRILCCP